MNRTDTMRGRLGWYATWQMRDYIMDRGLPTLFIGFFVGAQFILPMRLGLLASFGDAWATNPAGRAMLTAAIPQLVTTFALIGTLIAVNGIVSNDRRHGYVRFLFAKPVNVVRYYVQAFVVGVFGLTVTAAVLVAIFALVVAPLISPWAVLAVCIVALGVGGIGFLLSTLVRSDWLFLSLVIASSAMLRGLYGDAGGWRESLLVVLPPLHRLDDIRDPLLAGHAPAATDLGWVVGYGILCLLLGVVVLRRRPLAA